jgi:hypothetical protein
MVAVVRATIDSRQASPMAQPMSVLRIDMAQWVAHVVGMGDTGTVALRKRLARGGHPRGQIDIQLADGTIYSFGPEDLRLWEDVTGEGHRTRFPVPSVSISMPLPD